MADEILKSILGQSIVAAVLLFAVWNTYKDLKYRMEKADEERQQLLNYILDNTRRTKIIERETTGDTTPTYPRRPPIDNLSKQ